MADTIHTRSSIAYSRQQLAWCLLLGIIAAANLPHVADAQEEGEKKKDDARAFLIKIPLPITGDVDRRIQRKADQLLQRLEREAKPDAPRPVLVFEFGVEPGQNGKGSQFERSLALARFLSSRQFSSVRTVAYLPHGVKGHALLPVLACEQIIMHPEAELGEAGIDEESIDSTLRTVYRDMARKRFSINETVVQGMLDPSLEIYRVTTIEDEVRYLLTEEYQKLDAAGQVQNASTVVQSGQLARFTGDELRDKYQFVSHLVQDRRELARALEIPSGVIEDNPALGEEWRAVKIVLEGPIDQKTINWMRRSLNDQVQGGDVNLIVLQIDSAGGVPSESYGLAKDLADLDSNKIRTVAYVPSMAKGDAALIALACDHLVMGEEAVLGGPGNRPLATEKEREAAIASIQDLAKKKSRDWSLMAALVTRELVVHRYTRQGPYPPRYLCSDEHKDLTDHKYWTQGPEIDTHHGLRGRVAEDMKLARAVVIDWDEVKQLYQLKKDPELLKPNLAHSMISEFAQKLDSPWLKHTLLFIAFIALMSEVSSPGIGVPGFISAVCFGLFFWIQFLSGNALWLEVLLFGIGILFLALEIFVIPGFGLFGIGGAIMIIVSIILANQTFIVPHSDSDYKQLVSSLSLILVAGAGIGVALFVMRHFLHKTPFFRRMMLEPPLGEQRDELNQRESLVDLSHLIDQRGLTTTQLTPAGKARFDGEPVDVISDGDLIARGTEVRVVEVTGSRVQVEAIEEKSPTV